MKIIDSGTVFTGKDNTTTCGNYIPSVLAMSNGELLVCFRSGSGKAAADAGIAVTITGDKGETFSDAQFPFDTAFGGVEGSFWSAYASELENGEISMAVLWIDRQTLGCASWVNSETYGLLPLRTPVYKSRDFGRSWIYGGEIENTSKDWQLPLTNHIYKLSNGMLLCPLERYKNYYDKRAWAQAAVMKRSADGGKTWGEYSVVAQDETGRLWYNDQRGCVLSSGEIINYYPTFDTHRKEYVNVHMNSSIDNGKTWSAPIDTGVAGMSAAPVELSDGRIVISSSDQKTKTVDVYVSKNGGRCFSDKLMIYSAQTDLPKKAGKDYADWVDWRFGRPQIAKMSGNEIFAVYYAGSGGCTDIKWARCEV